MANGSLASVLISLGSNLGNREAFLREALHLLLAENLSEPRLSSVYETPPWGFDHPNVFLNMCLSANTALGPHQLLEFLMDTEKKLGRFRAEETGYSARTIDLDIILWDNVLIHSPLLEIPHPRAHLRRFVLMPAAEIEPKRNHPALNKNLETLLAECPDNSEIERVATLDFKIQK